MELGELPEELNDMVYTVDDARRSLAKLI